MTIKKALVVDDSRLARIALAKLLQKMNVECDMAGSGQEAIEYLHSNKPDVIFMDFMMTEMDGYQATQKICSNPESAMFPVVMCTSQDTEEDRKRARDSGARGFLTKPTTEGVLEKVLEAIGRIIEHRDVTFIRNSVIAPIRRRIPQTIGSVVIPSDVRK